MLLFYLQYNKGVSGSRQGKLPGGGGDRGDFGQGGVLTQNQWFAVAEHRAGTQGLGGELVDLGILGQADSGGVGLAVVDDKVIGKKLYDLMFGGSLAVMTEDLKNGIIACSPAIIFIVVVLIAALIVVAAAGKLKQPKRALVRAQAPIAILLAITLSVNGVILGVEYSVVNSVFAENVKVSDETMASGRAIADQIASEGIVLLKNDGKALPLSAGTKLNLFGWSSVRPLYGGTGSGDSDTSNAVSLIDGLKHAGFEVNEELVKFYENFRTERPVGTIRLREIGSKRGDFTVPEPTIAEYESANIFENAAAYSDTAGGGAVPAARALIFRRASPARMNTMHSNLLFRQQGHFPKQRLRRSLLSSTEITRAMSERSDDAFARSESVKHARTVCSCPGVLLFFARSPKASG